MCVRVVSAREEEQSNTFSYVVDVRISISINTKVNANCV